MTEVASGTFYPIYVDDTNLPTPFNVIQSGDTFQIEIKNRTVIHKDYSFGNRGKIINGNSLTIKITKEEYENLKKPPVLKGITTSKSYKKRSLNAPCPGEFLITSVKEDQIGGMKLKTNKRKTNKRKRKNAGKSRKHK